MLPSLLSTRDDHRRQGTPFARLLVTLACLTISLASLALPRQARAVDDASLDYETIVTPHFRVHYASHLHAFARRTARVAEEAHEILTPVLQNAPDSRTHIVVNDQVDTANGSATTFGRNTIRVFAYPPDPDGVLGFYSDWLRILVFHEYVHILHLDTTGGAVEWINNILGNLFHPNSILPRWYVEGLAVHHESQLTGTGRNNSSLFRMWLRTAALEDEFFSIGTVTGGPISWPQGTSPYLYGGFFFEYIQENYGENFGADFNHLYGRRMVPFSLNKTAEEVSGKTFHELWKEWAAYVQGQALAEHVAVQAQGATRLAFITDGGGQHRHPRSRPGTNQVTFYSSALDEHGRFGVTRSSSQDWETLFEVPAAAGASSWMPDGERLVFSRTAIKDNVYSYHDLFVWDADTEERHRLTRGERASDPAVSPDGRRIAYVRTLPGTTDLIVCHIEKLELYDCRTIAGGSLHEGDQQAHWQQISTPVWTPDAEGVIFSRWRLDEERRDLWHYRFDAPEGQRLDRITDDDAQDTAPHVGPDGLLYWSSDRTGIFNIYARRLDKGVFGEAAADDGERKPPETWQISNVDSGLFQPWVSNDGQWIYASAYTEHGYEIARFPRPTRLWDEAPDSYSHPDRPEYPDVDPDDWKQRNYLFLKWLNPLYLEPNFGAFTSGGGAGGTVRGEDPLGHHSYALSGALLTGETISDVRGSIGLNYSWSGGPINVNMSLAMQDNPRDRGFIAESRSLPYIQRRYAAQLGLAYPLIEVDSFLSLSSSYSVERTQFRNEPQVNHDPGDIKPQDPDFGWFNQLNLSLNYSNLDRYAQSISTERGIAGSLSLHVQNELLGSDVDSTFMTYGLRLYHPNPFVDRHVFRLRVTGGIARSTGGGARGFAVGGYRPQDVLADVILQNPRGQFVLRGYPPGLLVGSQFQVWTGAYRFPIARLETGPSTVPVYLTRIKGEIFADAGGAFNGLLADADLRSSVGAQIQLGTQFGYYLGGALRLGIARGLGEDGITEWFLLYGGGF